MELQPADPEAQLFDAADQQFRRVQNVVLCDGQLPFFLRLSGFLLRRGLFLRLFGFLFSGFPG